MNWQQRQLEFMKACGQPTFIVADLQDTKVNKLEVQKNIKLWKNLIREEVSAELLPHLAAIESIEPPHIISTAQIAQIADDIVDSIYVLCGLANCMGIPINSVFDAVHEANMSKVVDGKVLRRPDGKILKPLDWQDPYTKVFSIIQKEALIPF